MSLRSRGNRRAVSLGTYIDPTISPKGPIVTCTRGNMRYTVDIGRNGDASGGSVLDIASAARIIV